MKKLFVLFLLLSACGTANQNVSIIPGHYHAKDFITAPPVDIEFTIKSNPWKLITPENKELTCNPDDGTLVCTEIEFVEIAPSMEYGMNNMCAFPIVFTWELASVQNGIVGTVTLFSDMRSCYGTEDFSGPGRRYVDTIVVSEIQGELEK